MTGLPEPSRASSRPTRPAPWALVLLAFLALALLAGSRLSTAPAAGSDGPARLVAVRFAVSARPRARAQALEQAGLEQTHRVGAYLVGRAVDAPRAAATLARRPDVIVAAVDGYARVQDAQPNDPYFGGDYAWDFSRTQVPSVWTRTTGSSSVKIAVVDTGVDPQTEDLAGALAPGYNFVANDTDTSDDMGHGTTVAALIGARSDNGVGIAGVCGGCRIIPVKVAGSDGRALWSNVAAGITWAADQGADVINVSLAGPSGSALMAQAIDYARSKGALVVAAAGNDGGQGAEYPAAYPGVVSVEASNEQDGLYSFSNHGPAVSLAAPGCVATIDLGNSYVGGCGTSYAAPFVAGIAGLLKSAAPSLSGEQLAQLLEQGADHVPGVDSQYGRVDAWRSLGLAPVAPLSLAAPTVSGLAQAGQRLEAAPGSWSGPAPQLAYQWQRAGQGSWQDVPGATGSSYTVRSQDGGHQLRVKLTAENAYGQGVAYSAATATPAVADPQSQRPVALTPAVKAGPAVLSRPAIRGPAQAGRRLRASRGRWSGAPATFSYQWYACAQSCVALKGARRPTFLIPARLVGRRLVVLVGAQSGDGLEAWAQSQASAVVRG